MDTSSKGNTQKGVLETVIEIRDQTDNFIVREIVSLPMTLMVKELIFWGNQEKYEKHFGQIIDLGKTLAKINDSVRGYSKTETISLEELKNRYANDPNINTILGRKAPELDREVDYFLSGIKASLDILARILNPILDLNLNGWHRGNWKESKLSGADVLNSLDRNIPVKIKGKIMPFLSFIETAAPWLTYLVSLRDDVNHGGGIKSISNIYYDPVKKVVYPQYINHAPGKDEKVNEFMVRTMNEFNLFVNNFICHLYLSKAPNGMALHRKDNPVSYAWSITTTI